MTQMLILDALDTIQGYKGASLGNSKRFYQEHLARSLGMKVEDFLNKVPYESQLWLTLLEQQKGNLEPVMLPGADELLDYAKSHGIKPVIVTADIPESATNTARPFTDRKLIAPEDVHAIHHLGLKKNATTWAKAREAYFSTDNIAGVFEDTEANLVAALEAYGSDGYLVKTADTGIIVVSPRIVRGNLYGLRGELEKRLGK